MPEYNSEEISEGTYEISCAIEDAPYLPQLTVCKTLSLHILRHSEEEEVAAALGVEDSTPTTGDPTTLPNEDIPGECDDDDGNQVDEDALINSKTPLSVSLFLRIDLSSLSL